MTPPCIEETHVVDVYSKIASHFDSTRAHQWWWITEFITMINDATYEKKKVLDIGCGNGRNMDGFSNDTTTVYGIDNCLAFVNLLQERGKYVLYADMTSIPFQDKYFDFLLSIASFHHLASEERRLRALSEMKRIIKPNGLLLLSVWSRVQPPKTKQSREITDFGDILITWNRFGEIYQRYYYIFRIQELRVLFDKTGWSIEKHFWDYGNEIFVLKSL